MLIVPRFALVSTNISVKQDSISSQLHAVTVIDGIAFVFLSHEGNHNGYLSFEKDLRTFLR